MKTKMKKKKLVLKKITIAQLDKEDMNQAKGGTGTTTTNGYFSCHNTTGPVVC